MMKQFEPTTMQVRDLALAVAPKGASALILNVKNQHTGEVVPIEEAAEKGLAFFIRIDSHLSVLDLDLTQEPEIIRKVERMASDGVVPIVRWRSGSPGHEHWIYRVPSGVASKEWPPVENYGIANATRRWGGGINAGSAVRPPLSPHRKGLSVSLIEPQDVDEAIKLLRKPEQFETTLAPASESADMSTRTHHLLVYGDTDLRYSIVDSDGVIRPSRHAMLMGLAHSFIRDARLIDDFLASVLVRANKGAEKVHAVAREKGEAAAIKYAMKSWDDAIAWRRNNPGKTIDSSETAIEYLLNVRDAVQGYRGFNPRTEVTDRNVLLALIGVGLEVHKGATIGATIAPAPGLRRLALMSGYERKTVSKSLLRLENDGWIRRLDGRPQSPNDAGRNFPTRFQIQNKTTLTTPSIGPLPGAKPIDGVLDEHFGGASENLVHEAFHRSALGRGALETYGALARLNGWSSSAEIAAVTGMKVATVRRHLRKLGDQRLPELLVAKLGHVYLANPVTPSQLQMITDHFGTTGSLSKRADRYKKEQKGQQVFAKIRGIPHPVAGETLDLPENLDAAD